MIHGTEVTTFWLLLKALQEQIDREKQILNPYVLSLKKKEKKKNPIDL